MEKQPSEHPVRETNSEARQGPLGRPVLMVMLGGLLLAVLAWSAAEMFGEIVDNDPAATGQGGQNVPAKDLAPAGDQPATNMPVDRDPTPQTGTGGETQTNSPDGRVK